MKDIIGSVNVRAVSIKHPQLKTQSAEPDSLPVWSREKKLLVSSEDYGRDLTGVQNLRKKHKRLEAELAAHEPAIQVRRASSR